jgi:hypothetical protein
MSDELPGYPKPILERIVTVSTPIYPFDGGAQESG